jgi:hypothetical protein
MVLLREKFSLHVPAPYQVFYWTRTGLQVAAMTA